MQAQVDCIIHRSIGLECKLPRMQQGFVIFSRWASTSLSRVFMTTKVSATGL